MGWTTWTSSSLLSLLVVAYLLNLLIVPSLNFLCYLLDVTPMHVMPRDEHRAGPGRPELKRPVYLGMLLTCRFHLVTLTLLPVTMVDLLSYLHGLAMGAIRHNKHVVFLQWPPDGRSSSGMTGNTSTEMVKEMTST